MKDLEIQNIYDNPAFFAGYQKLRCTETWSQYSSGAACLSQAAAGDSTFFELAENGKSQEIKKVFDKSDAIVGFVSGLDFSPAGIDLFMMPPTFSVTNVRGKQQKHYVFTQWMCYRTFFMTHVILLESGGKGNPLDWPSSAFVTENVSPSPREHLRLD